MGSFVQSRRGMTSKFTEELCVVTTKNNAKFEEELICHLKTNLRNLMNFDWSTQKLKKNALIGSFTKVYNVSAKNSTDELHLMALKVDVNFEGEVTCAFKNEKSNLANIHRLK